MTGRTDCCDPEGCSGADRRPYSPRVTVGVTRQPWIDYECGTGTLAILIKRLHPTMDVVGLDPDPKALARAKRKTQRAGISIRLAPFKEIINWRLPPSLDYCPRPMVLRISPLEFYDDCANHRATNLKPRRRRHQFLRHGEDGLGC
ncbi:MAG: class I SAM-dependent methyltransferase [Verrucomicrobia bacterium]|nr:class I SAM-dependent methyltransferase [Verrucomicrobiota bacterium]